MRQIYYIRPDEDRSWVVSRFGHPLARLASPIQALIEGDDIARKAAASGVTAELRIARPDHTYVLHSVFEADTL